ncbi:calmodulin-binding protein 25 [Henckelia pumila]|uniref:calmodulin-binding protein 25 n=1 Tax=Henckelia pumila TaxID=405737 RepID=UPI003C6DC895
MVWLSSPYMSARHVFQITRFLPPPQSPPPPYLCTLCPHRFFPIHRFFCLHFRLDFFVPCPDFTFRVSGNLWVFFDLVMEQLWQIRPAMGDAWISDLFAKENETLTIALQKSFESPYSDELFPAEMVESLFAIPDTTPVTTPTVSGGSENEALPTKQRRSMAPTGRVTKRKPRASKRATTTFITADPSNFRQMVQQVTGVNFGGLNGHLPFPPVLKPEPHRLVSRLQPGMDFTAIDPSAFILDGAGGPLVSHLAPPPTTIDGGAAAGTGLDFDSFCGFPTLESWKVV